MHFKLHTTERGDFDAMASTRFNPRLIPVIATLSTPVISVFVVLVAAGLIQPLPAFGGGVAIILFIALLLRPYGGDLADIARFVRDLIRGEDRPIPTLETALASEVLAAISQLRRGWRARNDEMENLIGFHEVLFDSLPSSLFLLNGQRRIVRANLAARRIFGRQLQGRDLSAVLRNPALLDAAEQVLSGQAGCDVEFAVASPIERDFRAMVEPLPRPGVDGAQAILSLHDVTALRRMEQMRADFVANASHELRTPLSALLGFIETLRGAAKDDAEARERFLAIMYEQASRMSRLVADLLNLSRIELNEHTLPSGKANIGAIVRRVVEGLELTARQRNMRIDLDLKADLPTVVGQEDELAQIFQNLLDNALKYGRDGTPVEIVAQVTDTPPLALAERGGPVLSVSVRDHGDGIAREHLPRLTERFFRVDTARSRRLGGTGLGLAIVKHVVNRHRGVLTIDSTLGKGSIFTVFLPLSTE
jgi:two-component system phosphate regulon sensor histidine kinase PhoR